MAITELTSLQESTGSVCTKRKPKKIQRHIGTTETIRRIRIGRPTNLMKILHVSVTPNLDSRTGDVTKFITTLARKPPVSFTPSTHGFEDVVYLCSLMFAYFMPHLARNIAWLSGSALVWINV